WPRAAGTIPPAETERLLGRLTAGVIHDLNNYLHAADVTLALLRRQPHDADLWRQSEAALGAMGRLHTMLLAYARGGAQAPALVRVGPPTIAVRLDIAGRPPPLEGVRAQLEQLVLNLVINACEAMPDGGELVVTVRKSAAAAVVLEVVDSGSGGVPPIGNGRA